MVDSLCEKVTARVGDHPSAPNGHQLLQCKISILVSECQSYRGRSLKSAPITDRRGLRARIASREAKAEVFSKSGQNRSVLFDKDMHVARWYRMRKPFCNRHTHHRWTRTPASEKAIMTDRLIFLIAYSNLSCKMTYKWAVNHCKRTLLHRLACRGGKKIKHQVNSMVEIFKLKNEIYVKSNGES